MLASLVFLLGGWIVSFSLVRSHKDKHVMSWVPGDSVSWQAAALRPMFQQDGKSREKDVRDYRIGWAEPLMERGIAFKRRSKDADVSAHSYLIKVIRASIKMPDSIAYRMSSTRASSNRMLS